MDKATQHAIDFDTIDYFGGCPECGGQSEILNVERDHYAVCHEHKTFWLVGAHLFGAWRHENEAVWRKHADILESYQKVEPLLPPRYVCRPDQREFAPDDDYLF